MERNQKQYELVLILPPQTEGEDLDNTKKEIEEMVKKFEGTIEFKQIEKKDLAYPINKQGQGIYIISILTIIPDKVNDLSKELKINKKILRHLISSISITKKITKKPASKKALKRKREMKPKEKTDLKEIDQKLDDIIEKI